MNTSALLLFLFIGVVAAVVAATTNELLSPAVRHLVRHRKQHNNNKNHNSNTNNSTKRQTDDSACQVVYCLHAGAGCPDYWDLCDFDGFCGSGGVCTPTQPVGGACVPGDDREQNDEQCWSTVDFDAISCDGSTSTCQYTFESSYPNDFCTGTECVNGATCVAGRCVGIALGQTCSNTDACAFGLFCSNGVCAPRIAQGASCAAAIVVDSIDVCDSKSSRFCGADNTCVAPFTVPAGSNCTWVDQCELNSYCAFAATYNPFGKCIPVPATPVPCQKVDEQAIGVYDCVVDGFGYEQSCECNAAGGGASCHGVAPMIRSPCTVEQYTQLQTCLIANQCSMAELDPGFLGPSQSCASHFCEPEISCMNYCNSLNEQDDIAKQCIYSNPKWSCKLSASSSVQVLWMTIFAGFVVQYLL